jgi:hypothetical protein
LGAAWSLTSPDVSLLTLFAIVIVILTTSHEAGRGARPPTPHPGRAEPGASWLLE